LPDKKKVIKAAREPAKPKRQINYRRFIIILIAIVIVFSAAGFNIYHDRLIQEALKQKIDKALARAVQLESEKEYVAAREMYMTILVLDDTTAGISEKVGALKRRIALRKEARAYFDKLKISDIRLVHTNGDLRLFGSIANAGNRHVKDIELTIYCLDEEDRPVCQQHHVTTSSDGKPLKKNELRRFVATIPDISNSAKEVQVIISDIDFAD
jgi:hypothetical protein